MGSIVSSKKQVLSESEIYPSESYAREAKHRQAALKGLHLPLVRKLHRKDAFDLSSASDEDDIREWYPAGVSPWYYNEETGVLVMPADGSHWMDGITISAMELHRAAIIIQRVIRGHQTRKSLIREHEGATKIQRTYRSYKRRQSTKLLRGGVVPSYLKTFRISDSVAKGINIPSENCLVWQNQSAGQAEDERSKDLNRSSVSRSDVSNAYSSDGGNSSYLRIVQGEDHNAQEILKAVEVPVSSDIELLQSLNSRESEMLRQNPAAASTHLTAKREEIAIVEKDITFKNPILQHGTAARKIPPPSQSFTTSMRTWTPEASYSNPVSPDSGLGRLTESRESEKSVFSSHPSVRGIGPSNGPMGSLPSLKGSLPSLRGSLPSLKESLPSLRESNPSLRRSSVTSNPTNLRDSHPNLRDMTMITTYDSQSEQMFTNDANSEFRSGLNSRERSRKGLRNSAETGATPFRLTRPWPLSVQIKPDSDDAQKIAKALDNDGGSHLAVGGHHGEQDALGDPLMHPVMFASNSLKARIRNAGRGGSTPNRAAMMKKSQEPPKFLGDPLSTVKGTNYQRLMDEMRQQRRVEIQQREAEKAASRKEKEENDAALRGSSTSVVSLKSESHSSVSSRTRLQPSTMSSSTRDPVSVVTNKTAKEGDNMSYIPQLSIITEDESSDERSTFSLKDRSLSPDPNRSSNTLTVPNNNLHLMKMDPLIKLLYQEISENNEELTSEQSRNDPKDVGNGQAWEGNEGEGEEGEGDEKEIELTPELIERVRTAIIKRQLTKKGTRSMMGSSKGVESPMNVYGKDSILIAPPDVETLLKAAEFRGGAVKKLKHLTTSIRLDYHEFINSVEQTLYYVAQQAEAGLDNYHPPTVLLISSSVPKYKILRHAAKPGVLAHVYDFSANLTDLLNDIAQLLENFRPGAKAKNLGIVCKGGPGYIYLVKKVPVTPAKLRNRDEILQFWQGLGHHMSKLYPGQSVIHLMESNVAGNRQGENLLSDLEAALYSHQVKVVSPLEMAPSGREMLNMYFDPGKHKLWKMMRYTKLRMYK